MIGKFGKRLKKVGASIALLSAEMLVVLAVFMTSLVAFVLITRRVFTLGSEEFDHAIFDYLEQYVTPATNRVMKTITFFGTHEFLIPANLILIAWFLFVRKHKWYSIKIPAIAISSLLMMFGLKRLFGRERPPIPLLEEAKGLSYPSGHALMSMTFYGLIIYIIWHSIKNPTLRWALISILLIWIFLIGFSRIYLRVHYPTDVMAGFAMGFLWLVTSIWMLKQIEKYSRRKLNPVVQQA
ncbi:MAG TPA: phosphatase PAP2 family protein [Flavisolibacter sp.]|jgi:undecaprenyl-diphosphatase